MLTMPMSTALRRLMAAERPPTEAGDRTYRRRCGGINRALGWCAPWDGAPARSIRRFCCGLCCDPNHAHVDRPPQADGGGEAPNRGGGPDIWTQVRRDQLGPRVVRAVGWGASPLNSTILLWFVIRCDPNHAHVDRPPQADGGGGPPNRGGRPDIWMQVRRDQLRPRVVRAVGRGASSLNSTILLWFVM